MEENNPVESMAGVSVGHNMGGCARSLSCNCVRGLQKHQVREEVFGHS